MRDDNFNRIVDSYGFRTWPSIVDENVSKRKPDTGIIIQRQEWAPQERALCNDDTLHCWRSELEKVTVSSVQEDKEIVGNFAGGLAANFEN